MRWIKLMALYSRFLPAPAAIAFAIGSARSRGQSSVLCSSPRNRGPARSSSLPVTRSFKSIEFHRKHPIQHDRIPSAIQRNHEEIEIEPVSIPIGLGFPLESSSSKDPNPSTKTTGLLHRTLESQQEDTIAKIQEMEDKIQRLATKLEAISHVTEVQMKINRVNLSYGSGKLIATPRNRSFRARLLEAYGYKRFSRGSTIDKKLYCPAIDRLVPARSLIAAHLFKHEWARVAQAVMGLEDIDDPANGLMLFSPIEYCFDRLQLCFLVDPESSDGGRDQIVCRVLDPSIRDRLLVSVAESRGNWSGSDDPELAALSFAAIDGARLKFITNHRPLREALNFHARQARLHAISRGWIDESWDFRDFYTDRERWEKMRIWIDQKLTKVD